MAQLNINRTVTTDYSNADEHTIDDVALDGISDTDETVVMKDRFNKDWSYFNGLPKLKSAVLMRGIWTVGKGWTADTRTEVILSKIDGNGKETFNDILLNMEVTRIICGDSFAEIIRDSETDQVINLKILDPSTMRIIYGRDGRIKRYEQTRPVKTNILGRLKSLVTQSKDNYIKYKREEILHFTYNNFAGETHGRGVPEMLEKYLLADDESFKLLKKINRFQAVPFMIFKVKTDDQTTLNTFKTNLRSAREDGEDLILPDDENIVSWEVVQLNPSNLLLEWRQLLNSEIYRALGLPMVLFGSAGTTESGGKIEYLGHETVFESNQHYVESQIRSQLGFEIKLNSPTSLIENLQADENKDSQNALTFQQNDVEAGSGR